MVTYYDHLSSDVALSFFSPPLAFLRIDLDLTLDLLLDRDDVSHWHSICGDGLLLTSRPIGEAESMSDSSFLSKILLYYYKY